MNKRQTKSEKTTALVVTTTSTAGVTLIVHRPGGVPNTVTGPDISFEVVANGTLVIVGANGKATLAFSPGQWLTVGVPPV